MRGATPPSTPARRWLDASEDCEWRRRIVMVSPVGILALLGKGYTFTHTVAEGVKGLTEPRRVSLVQLAAVLKSRAAPTMLSTTLQLKATSTATSTKVHATLHTARACTARANSFQPHERRTQRSTLAQANQQPTVTARTSRHFTRHKLSPCDCAAVVAKAKKSSKP